MVSVNVNEFGAALLLYTTSESESCSAVLQSSLIAVRLGTTVARRLNWVLAVLIRVNLSNRAVRARVTGHYARGGTCTS